jgi:mono/diheme cytochrome c family protein
MKVWLATVLCAVWACAARPAVKQPAGDAAAGALLVEDTTRAPSELACAHCHASRAQLEAGGISPGPPWPGTLARTTLKGVAGLPAADAVVRCGSHYQTRAPSPQEARDILAFLEGQGGALPGQPAVYDPTPRDEALAKTLLALPPDLDQGEAVFARACARCHRNGPGYALDVLQSQARLEVIEKLLQVPHDPRKSMPHIPRGVLSDQQLVDVAAYVSP